MQQNETFQSFHFTSDDGIDLHGRIQGGSAEDQRPVVCLPGLSRNSRDFYQIARILAAQGRRVIALDYRGRGLSAWDPNPANYNLLREAQDVLQAMAHLGITEADFIGTSRGGLILHFLPAMAPGLVRSLVLNDIGPVIEIEGLRQIRDYLSARQEPGDLDEAARGLKATHGDAFSALGDRDWREMADAIYRDIGGRLVPDYDPALVEPLKIMDLSVPPPDLWEQFTALAPLPLLIIRGENSSLLSIATVEEMLRRHGRARSITAPGQGHAPLLHLPEVAIAMNAFLQDV
ncbi:MAG: alpha/beta hydrolase [Rhizobium sp.]|nr:alpha/beta hydrolase [Rhizobium sp.]